VRTALFSCLLAVAAGAFAISAASAAAVSARPAAANALTLRLINLDAGGGAGGTDALVDVGAVSARHRGDGKGQIQVRKRVALRLDGPYPSARVSVALAVDMAGAILRVDGHTIGAIPRVIDPVHRVGATVVHEIELTIPANVPAGAFLGNLHWLAETD
jgi:hypothetical protein